MNLSCKDLVVGVLALAGDASDNVPGCPGIGAKTAARLIQRWGSVDALYVSVLTGYTDGILTPRIARLLRENMSAVFTSKALVDLSQNPLMRTRQ